MQRASTVRTTASANLLGTIAIEFAQKLPEFGLGKIGM